MHLDEKILLQEISDGSEKAFQQLFTAYRDRLFAYAYKLVKSRELAEEITMDVFVKVWDGRELAGEIENLEGFLFKMCSNRAIDFLRKAAKDNVLRDILWEDIQIAGSLNPENAIIEKDLQAKLKHIIDMLPKQRRIVFQLSREEGLSYEQIAQQLQVSKNTVRNQMVEALRFIRTQLNVNKELILLLIFLKKF